MKNLLLSMTLLVLCVNLAQAQCEKNVKITSSSTKRLDAAGNLISETKETIIFHISKKGIDVEIGGGIVANAEIAAMECNWPIPFNTGKTTIKGVLVNAQGDRINLSNVIEGKNGVITITATLQGGQDSMIIHEVTKFEEDF